MNSGTLIVTRPDGELQRLEVHASITIGRAPGNDLVLTDSLVSREHARLERFDDGRLLVIDLGSANGTLVNGKLLSSPARLEPGDLVKIGDTELRLERQEVREDAPEEDPEAADRTNTGAPAAATRRASPERRMLGRGPRMAQVFRLIDVAGSSPIPVLIDGETGTGKELAARAVHDASDRADGPFLALNCATLVESLLESELFGHRRGAFTGADRDHAGLFEAASGGTVFLDEVGEMPAATQPKLLRVLEENEVVRVGESRPRAVDVRIISATNRDLNEAVNQGEFRSDLFFRLATFPIRMPSLRERREDIPLLVRHAAEVAAQRHKKRIVGVSKPAMDALVRHRWPGNVRELRNELQRAVALCRDGDEVDVRHLSDKIVAMADRTSGGGLLGRFSETPAASAPPAAQDSAESNDLRAARAAFETEHITRVLEENKGHVGKTAEALGLSRTALHKKLKEYGIR